MKTFVLTPAGAKSGLPVSYDPGSGNRHIRVGQRSARSIGSVVRVGLTRRLTKSGLKGKQVLDATAIKPASGWTLDVSENPNSTEVLVLIVSQPDSPPACSMEIEIQAPRPEQVLAVGERAVRRGGRVYRYPEILAVIQAGTMVRMRVNTKQAAHATERVGEKSFVWNGRAFIEVFRGTITVPVGTREDQLSSLLGLDD